MATKFPTRFDARALLDQQPDLVLLASPRGKVVFANQAAREFWSLKPGKLKKRRVWDLLSSTHFSQDQLLELTGRLGHGDQLRLALLAHGGPFSVTANMDVRIRLLVVDGRSRLLFSGRAEALGRIDAQHGESAAARSKPEILVTGKQKTGKQKADRPISRELCSTPSPQADQPSLEQAFANLSDHYLRIDERGAILAASPNFAATLGLRDADNLGRHSLRKFVSDVNWQQLHQVMSLAEGRCEGLELEFQSLAGESLLFSFSGSVWHHAGGWIGGIEGILRRVADSSPSSGGPGDSESRYRALFSGGNDAVLVLRNYEIIEINNRALEIFGATPEQIVGHALGAISPALQPGHQLSSELIKQYYGAVINGQSQRFEWRGRRFDGEVIDLDVSLSRIDLAGEPCVQAIMRDVTEELAQQVALRRSEQVYNTIVEHSGDGIVFIDLDRKVLFSNSQFQQMVGCAADQVQGQDYLQFLDKGTRESAAALFIKSFTTGEDLNAQVWISREDGTRSRIEINAVLTDYNEMPALIAFVRDITHQFEAAEELRAHRDTLADQVAQKTRSLTLALNQAESANRAKSRFLANMSHELRTPLHAVLSFAEFGESRSADGDLVQLQGYFSRIQASGRRLLALLNDLLDLTELEAGSVNYFLEWHDLRQLVGKVLDDMQLEIGDRKVIVNAIDAGDPVRAYCDFDRIAQVVNNLVSNALKFSGEETQVGITLSSDHHRQAMVMVDDQGVGLPEDEKERLFDPFVESVRTRSEAGGTGLGLAICKQIINAHGGTIGGFNKQGGGASFYFTLPAKPSEESV